jgi:hypothetical protein
MLEIHSETFYSCVVWNMNWPIQALHLSACHIRLEPLDKIEDMLM